MTPHQAKETEPLGARGASVVLMQDLQEAAPHVSGQDRHRPAGQSHGGKDEVPECIPQPRPALFDEPIGERKSGEGVDSDA